MNRQDFIRWSVLLSVVPIVTGRISPTAAAAPITAATFMRKAGEAGLFEIQSSKVVLARASAPEVKSFAERMVADHTKAAEDLKAAAAGKHDLPAALDEKHRKLMEDLKGAGSRLDAVYVEMQVKAHEEAVELFGNYGKKGDDAALQAFAMKTLPTLQMHLDMIKKIQAQQS